MFISFIDCYILLTWILAAPITSETPSTVMQSLPSKATAKRTIYNDSNADLDGEVNHRRQEMEKETRRVAKTVTRVLTPPRVEDPITQQDSSPESYSRRPMKPYG